MQYCLKKYHSLIFTNEGLINKFNNLLDSKQGRFVVNVAVDIRQFRTINKNDIKKEFNINNNSKIVLFIGRLEPHKMPFFALDIFKELYNIDNNYYFWIVGSGSLESKILEKVITEEVGNVNLIGFVSESELYKYYNAADVLIITSVHEGGPQTIKEALACNLPVVSTDVGDVKEVIEGIEGCYIADPQVDDFVDKIQLALATKNFESRSKIEKYSAENFGQSIMKIYSEVK